MQNLRYSKYFKGIVMLIDMIFILGILAAFYLQREKNLEIHSDLLDQNGVATLVLILFWFLLSGTTKLYSIPRNLSYIKFLERLLMHLSLFLFGLVLLGKISDNVFLKGERFWLALVLLITLFLEKTAIFYLLKWARYRGINIRNVMFMGGEYTARSMVENDFRNRKEFGFRIFEYSGDEDNFEELEAFWKKHGIFRIYLPTEHSALQAEARAKLYDFAEKNNVEISLIPDLEQNHYFFYELNYVDMQPVLNPGKFPLDYFSNVVLKRILDITFSLAVLVLVCSWLFPILAILIKMDSRGPVFFIQKRYGYRDQLFNCLKFRTMKVGAELENRVTEKGDVRITKFGNFLRKSSLDELPQFINVLFGDMSVVGPRPHMPLIEDYYKPKIGRYAIRNLVQPGITGLAQIQGLRGERGNMKIHMQKRILADAYYVKNWSLILDIFIIFKTIILLLKGDKNAQ